MWRSTCSVEAEWLSASSAREVGGGAWGRGETNRFVEGYGQSDFVFSRSHGRGSELSGPEHLVPADDSGPDRFVGGRGGRGGRRGSGWSCRGGQ